MLCSLSSLWKTIWLIYGQEVCNEVSGVFFPRHAELARSGRSVWISAMAAVKIHPERSNFLLPSGYKKTILRHQMSIGCEDLLWAPFVYRSMFKNCISDILYGSARGNFMEQMSQPKIWRQELQELTFSPVCYQEIWNFPGTGVPDWDSYFQPWSGDNTKQHHTRGWEVIPTYGIASVRPFSARCFWI